MSRTRGWINRALRPQGATPETIYDRLGTVVVLRSTAVRKTIQALITVLLACLVIDVLPIEAAFFLASGIVIGGIVLSACLKTLMAVICRRP